MLVLVMDIGHMRMGVRERLVPVEMRVRLACWFVRRMSVPMMLVVRVEVVVRDDGVSVLVLVMFAQVQPNAERHERGGDPETPGRRIGQEQKRKRGANEGRGGKIGACPRGSEMTQGEHEQCETDSVTEKSDCAGGSHHA